jgi:hypothetical protein
MKLFLQRFKLLDKNLIRLNSVDNPITELFMIILTDGLTMRMIMRLNNIC